MEPEYWKQIKSDKFENGLLQGHAKVTKTKHIGTKNGTYWQLITFKPFIIMKQTDLAFIWKDIENLGWKQDMYWDYVQIEEV